jgi:D-aspartate ligase
MDALILGASPNALSVARSLGRAGFDVALAESRVDAAVKSSRYVQRYVALEATDDAGIVSRLMMLHDQPEKPLLFPTGDRFALLVARFQAELKSKYCFVCPAYAVLEAIVDKAMLCETARRNGIPHPRFHVVRDRDDIDLAIAAVPTPCYVKPALAHEWRNFKHSKVERADSAEQLRQILEGFVDKRLTAVPQEIIQGKDSEVISVSAYIDRSGKCLGFRNKRKLRQWPVGAGDASCQETCDEPEVAELGLRLLAITGYRGPATVEFRRDERTGRFALMEINARTILGQEMITRSGLDVALLAYYDAKGLPMPQPAPAAPIRWLYLGADYRAFRELQRRGQITTAQWLKSILSCRAFAYFAPDDPGPFLARVRIWLGHHFNMGFGSKVQ